MPKKEHKTRTDQLRTMPTFYNQIRLRRLPRKAIREDKFILPPLVPMENVTQSANQVTVKLFLGIPLTFEIRSSLNKNPAWHQTLVKPFEERDLLEIHHANSDYIGLLLSGQSVLLKHLKIERDQLIARLKNYCPALNEGTLKVCVFSQLYIS